MPKVLKVKKYEKKEFRRKIEERSEENELPAIFTSIGKKLTTLGTPGTLGT